jgi:hypothetical protein
MSALGISPPALDISLVVKGLMSDTRGRRPSFDQLAMRQKLDASCKLAADMRPLVALQTCLGLLASFFVAPFEHVHGAGADHDHAGLIHAHFYSLPSPHRNTGLAWDDVDDDHRSAWSVDTFTLALTAGLELFVPSPGPRLHVVLVEFFPPARAIEERAHAPPPLDASIPRAPPC